MPELKRIALAVPLGWEYTHLLTEGILQYQAERGGFSLRDFRFDDPTFVLPHHPPTWEGWNPAGVLSAIGNEPGLAEWLLSAKLPMVNMTVDVDPHLIPCVHATGGAKLAIDHLASLGIRHFAHVGLRGLFGSEVRFSKFSHDVKRLGLEPLRYEVSTDPVGSLDSRLREAAAEPGLLAFLKAAPKPLGICALNDDFARCVCLACHTLGLRIPAEVAVVGVDDTTAARLSDPPLTSVRPPGKKVGFGAMRMLDQLLLGGEAPREPIEIPCTEIVVRQSTQLLKDDSIERAMRIIESEATRGLTVGDLVRQLAISRSNLEKQFQEHFGITPGQEIKRVKLEKAKELLRQTELSITRISAMLGYSRNSVFSEFFRGCEGMTPSEYRHSHTSHGS